jgi:FAD/FMN-containing dehydrogenase
VIAEELSAIVGAENVITDPDALAGYGRDHSGVSGSLPGCVVRPDGAPQMQAVIKAAAARRMPVTARSSAVGFYGAALPAQGGVVLDLSRMNRILEIDGRNKKCKLEPGVTWGQAVPALAAEGLMVCGPLLPHKDKSVLTTALEREPIMIPKNEYSEVFLTAEMVVASGEMFWTGTAAGKGMKGRNFPDGLIPGTRLFLGAQGTLGVVSWANLKAEWLPSRDKVFFIACDSLAETVEPLYRIQRRMMGNECLVLNDQDFATLLAREDMGDFAQIRDALPPYTIIFVLAGLHRLPAEKIAYEEEALHEVAAELHIEVARSVGGIPGLADQLAGMLRAPWPGQTHWRQRYLGGSREVFFNIPLDRAAEIVAATYELAGSLGYATGDVGVYLQPLERARVGFLNFSFPFDPADAAVTAQVNRLYIDASELAMRLGGFFSAPYGPWADMVYSRAAAYTETLKVVKRAFDPDNILNPGKLCF